MKIVMVIANYYPDIGGLEIFAQRDAEYMARHGHEVKVVTLNTGGWNRYELLNGVHVYRVNFLKKVKYLNFSMPVAITMKALSLDFDIIHALSEVGMVVGGVLKKAKRKPLLITGQGGDMVDYASYGQKGSGLRRRLVRYGVGNADMVHAVSQYVKSTAEELGARRVEVIPNGIDVSEFRPLNKTGLKKALGYSDSEKVVISVSRLTAKNGLDYLIRASRLITDINLRLLIIGDGDQKGNLERLVQDLGMQDRVRIMGWVPNDQIPRYLNAADLFVRPAREEGFGISFIEAMACKTPVIGSNAGGIPDIIQDGENGFMVTPDDIDGIAARMRDLLTDAELRARLAENGYQTVQRKFTWDVVLSRVNHLYEELTQRQGGA